MSFKEFLKATLNKPLPEDKVEYFKLRSRVSGYILTKAQQNSPTCGYNYEADITKFWEVFQDLKENCGYELSFNTLMMKVLTEGLKAAPKLNSHIDFNTTNSCGTLIMKKHIDIAMPVLLDNGETFPIKVRETENNFYQNVSENEPYICLVIWTENVSGNVTIEFPDGLIPDNTCAGMEDVLTDSGKFTIYCGAYTSYEFRFFKDVSYSGINSFNVTLKTAQNENIVAIKK